MLTIELSDGRKIVRPFDSVIFFNDRINDLEFDDEMMLINIAHVVMIKASTPDEINHYVNHGY